MCKQRFPYLGSLILWDIINPLRQQIWNFFLYRNATFDILWYIIQIWNFFLYHSATFDMFWYEIQIWNFFLYIWHALAERAGAKSNWNLFNQRRILSIDCESRGIGYVSARKSFGIDCLYADACCIRTFWLII